MYQKGFDATETADILDLDKTYVSIIYELLQKYPEREDGQIARMYLQKIENMQVKKSSKGGGKKLDKVLEIERLFFEEHLKQKEIVIKQYNESFDDEIKQYIELSERAKGT